jgi:hypothetical protein
MVPRGARTDKDVHANLNARIAIYTTQRDTVHGSVMNATKRGAASSAKAEAPSQSGLVPRQLFLSFGPFERPRRNFCVGRSGTAERLSTARAMAASCIDEWSIDFILNSTTEASSGNCHDVSCVA